MSKSNDASKLDALIITPVVREHLIKIAGAYTPREVCGVLSGRKKGNIWQVNNFHWVANISQEPDQWDYIMDPQAYSDIVTPIFRDKWVSLVGIFHTHPNGQPIPSRIDIDRANESGENIPYLIYAPNGGGFRAWMITRQPTREIECKKY